MEKLEERIIEWGESVRTLHFPRWDELPEIELYMDQVITLVEQYLSPVIRPEKNAHLTPSMVNNYVKKDMIPAPVKKRYNRKHVAFLIAITLLKQVLTIPEIKDGILFQGKAIGIKNAYNAYCDIQEHAIHQVALQAMRQTLDEPLDIVPIEYLATHSASKAFAYKLLAEKMIEFETDYLKEGAKK